ncbi:ABATE domain-containing protein [Streptomyces sp. NRRL B-24085]|uniref:CGNR zinc finger domain-containing protein n=1 Tax=Streptomyces sp. NRRL B-24085 TaxID=1709476 RepID=UPI0006B32DA7|nr:ABATE domain-containing protein [Streptomyces sp. NRRL B-24085]
MTGSPAPVDPALAFPFVGGRPCLDFAATLGKRHATPLERLPDTDALARWFTEAELATGEDPVRVTTRDLAQARLLRESVYALVRAAMAGREPDPSDVERVNAAAAQPDLAPQLGPARWTARSPARAALATVARDAVLLVRGPLLERVKECENPGCSLLFLDDSQARRRRWCSMDRCGNLAKIAGYRSRSRAAVTR